MKAPVHHPHEYYNSKCFHSVMLAAVLFLCSTNINEGWPSTVHVRVFLNSLLGSRRGEESRSELGHSLPVSMSQ